ncbi:hypothetical protein D1B31_16330 [Neobacillus notoginsengisoli]|uniref:Uncharacterized protein n=1 Tax=Neobacillus notoginsengisoli TaxID=1578198 RepID=A0A417YRL0_9BACI|nr:hypothetical protein [Neobacillus notoginsengisoli]RHW37330.1 hypothetical protein D1B31_16330 [Neobacillus notoginsengisoli]
MDESKQILTALARLEENVKNMNSKIDGFSKVSELALQTEQSAKSAHNRIDDIKVDMTAKIIDIKKDYEDKIAVECKAREKMESHITWLWRTLTGSIISFVFGIVLFFLTKGG